MIGAQRIERDDDDVSVRLILTRTVDDRVGDDEVVEARVGLAGGGERSLGLESDRDELALVGVEVDALVEPAAVLGARFRIEIAFEYRFAPVGAFRAYPGAKHDAVAGHEPVLVDHAVPELEDSAARHLHLALRAEGRGGEESFARLLGDGERADRPLLGALEEQLLREERHAQQADRFDAQRAAARGARREAETLDAVLPLVRLVDGRQQRRSDAGLVLALREQDALAPVEALVAVDPLDLRLDQLLSAAVDDELDDVHVSRVEVDVQSEGRVADLAGSDEYRIAVGAELFDAFARGHPPLA